MNQLKTILVALSGFFSVEAIKLFFKTLPTDYGWVTLILQWIIAILTIIYMLKKIRRK